MAANKSKGKAPSGGGIGPKVILAAVGIAAISSLSSFVAIRLAMPRQVIIEKHIITEKGMVVNGKSDDKKADLPTEIYDAGDFTVNLADPGHHLRASVTLAIQADGSPPPSGGDGKKDPGAAFRAEMAPYDPIYKDVIITELSNQNMARLDSFNGKEMIKDELKVALNKAVPDKKVVGVYFTDFVYQ